MTTDAQYTRCPGCLTVFRVTAAQLALREGQVRCGHCRTVFDGNAQMISLAPMPRDTAEAERDDLSLGPPTVTLRSPRALEPAPSPSARPIPEPSFRPEVADVPIPKATIRTVADTDRSSSDGWRGRRRDRSQRRWWAAAIPVLAVTLIGQALFHFRDSLAAHWPATKPALTMLCQAAGCTIRPLRDVAGLAIDASDLQADPAHKGLLILSATIRNRAGTALAYPYLELMLTDSSDQIVVRRALAPSEYASGTVETALGIPANGEVLVKLFIDASATSQAGYRLYLFYP
jgi:predicted Zn finger-like uncharacterized protein